MQVTLAGHNTVSELEVFYDAPIGGKKQTSVLLHKNLCFLQLQNRGSLSPRQLTFLDLQISLENYPPSFFMDIYIIGNSIFKKISQGIFTPLELKAYIPKFIS